MPWIDADNNDPQFVRHGRKPSRDTSYSLHQYDVATSELPFELSYQVY